MTHLLALAAGATIGALAVYGRHLRWAEAHHYRQVRLEYTRVRALAVLADHEHRTAVRWQRATEALRAIHEDVVGDLLDTVKLQSRQLDALVGPVQPAAPRYSPAVWTYGRPVTA